MIISKRGDRGPIVKYIQKQLHLSQVDGRFGRNTEMAVRSYQQDHLLFPDGIVGPATWKKLTGMDLKQSCRRINDIIIHCTATPAGRDYTVDDIRRWHRERGWSDIGYHYVVYRDGSIHNGRDVDISGAHCQGHNANSIGIVYVGGMTADNALPKDTRTQAQKDSLQLLVYLMKKLYFGVSFHGHRDYDKGKACPSFDVKTMKI